MNIFAREGHAFVIFLQDDHQVQENEARDRWSLRPYQAIATPGSMPPARAERRECLSEPRLQFALLVSARNRHWD